MDPADIARAQAEAAALAAYQGSLFSNVYFWLPLLIVFGMYLLMHWSPVRRRMVRKQSDFLDFQRKANEQALEQNKTFEDMIRDQYAATNSRDDQALVRAEEALRLHAAGLEQLVAMNQALARIAQRLDTERPAPPQG